MIAPERLLSGFALLPVPVALTAGLIGKIALGAQSAGTSTVALSGAKVGLISTIFQTAVAHPVAVILVAGSLATGAVTANNWSDSPGPVPYRPNFPTVATSMPSTTVASPTTRSPSAIVTRPTAPLLKIGPVSLELANEPGAFISARQTAAVLTSTGTSSSQFDRRLATFAVVAGLADATCFSFRLSNGQFLRHSSWRLRVFSNDSTPLFRGDATFCVRAGLTAGSISLESSNYPGWFIHHRGCGRRAVRD